MPAKVAEKVKEEIDVSDEDLDESIEEKKPLKKALKKKADAEEEPATKKTKTVEPAAKKPNTPAPVVKSTSSSSNMPKKNDRNNMSHPKGTYVLRMQDVDTERSDHLWRVDNHQLLQYYSRIDANDKTRYQRTNRYTGWFCSEGYKYLAVKVEKKVNKEEEVVIVWPAQEKLDNFKGKYDAEEKRINDEKEAEEAGDDD